MSNSLKDILAKRNAAEPPEIQLIKNFVRSKINSPVSVSISTNQIALWVPSAAAAGSLRMHIYELKNRLETTKRLVIRIGQNSV